MSGLSHRSRALLDQARTATPSQPARRRMTAGLSAKLGLTALVGAASVTATATASSATASSATASGIGASGVGASGTATSAATAIAHPAGAGALSSSAVGSAAVGGGAVGSGAIGSGAIIGGGLTIKVVAVGLVVVGSVAGGGVVVYPRINASHSLATSHTAVAVVQSSFAPFSDNKTTISLTTPSVGPLSTATIPSSDASSPPVADESSSSAVKPPAPPAAPRIPTGEMTAHKNQVASLRALDDETSTLREVQQSLQKGSGSDALQLLDDLATRHPNGALREEQLAARVLALCAAGRVDEATVAGRAFLNELPDSIQADRVRGSCAFTNKSATDH